MELSVLTQLPVLVKAAILGVVEGATEFIPVSSTGHLIIAGDWLGFTGEDAKAFEIFIQLGAILAIVWLYRQRLTRVVRTVSADPLSRRLVVNLAIAFLPAAVVGLLTHRLIKEYLFSTMVVAISMLVGGVIILVIERWHPKPTVATIDDVAPTTALGIGLAQVLSLIPGTSRSGATIMGGYCLGLTRQAATEFSFFLAIPVMIAATAFDLSRSTSVLSAADVPVFAVGFVVAFLTALVVVRAFVSYVARSSFAAFAWYRIAFGLLFLLWHARYRG
ncbi:MAG TPA: undecaprenyl-diphosphate phosphatase [Gemmatimonadales bacterium]